MIATGIFTCSGYCLSMIRRISSGIGDTVRLIGIKIQLHAEFILIRGFIENPEQKIPLQSVLFMIGHTEHFP